MKRIGLLGLMLVAICAFGGVTASSSMAACLKVAEVGTGTFKNSQCTETGAGEFIWIKKLVTYLGNGVWCGETTLAGEGNYTTGQCTTKVAGSNFAKVLAGPFWHVQGKQLEQGKARQVKLQLKGKAVLSAPTLGATGLEIKCSDSGSEGATLENGLTQGQGKGRVTYSQCEVIKPTLCKVAEPIQTKQIKSYLADETGEGSKNFVEVFEPTELKTFVELKFSGSGCGVLVGSQSVSGSVYAEVIPKEVEGQEGLLSFPTAPLEKIKHGGVATLVGLTAGGVPAIFSGSYGAQLAQFPEQFGVFGG
jgi:hypothetical protein